MVNIEDVYGPSEYLKALDLPPKPVKYVIEGVGMSTFYIGDVPATKVVLIPKGEKKLNGFDDIVQNIYNIFPFWNVIEKIDTINRFIVYTCYFVIKEYFCIYVSDLFNSRQRHHSAAFVDSSLQFLILPDFLLISYFSMRSLILLKLM
ncbi:MAG: hypothetical protein QXU98_05315 [Candidatus Parvarchaeota archaeon]